MIKVNVIEKEAEILLGDLEYGTVVELEIGVTGIVTYANSRVDVHEDQKCLVFIGEGGCPTVANNYGKWAIKGTGDGKIKRIIGTLTGIEVTAK